MGEGRRVIVYSEAGKVSVCFPHDKDALALNEKATYIEVTAYDALKAEYDRAYPLLKEKLKQAEAEREQLIRENKRLHATVKKLCWCKGEPQLHGCPCTPNYAVLDASRSSDG